MGRMSEVWGGWERFGEDRRGVGRVREGEGGVGRMREVWGGRVFYSFAWYCASFRDNSPV